MIRSTVTRRVLTYLLTASVAGVGIARVVTARRNEAPIMLLSTLVVALIFTALAYVLLRHFLLADPPTSARSEDPAEHCGRIAGEIDLVIEQLQRKAVELQREGRFQAAELIRFDTGQLRTLADRMRGLSRRLRDTVEEEAA